MKYCKKCGYVWKDEDVFCDKCGTKLSDIDATKIINNIHDEIPNMAKGFWKILKISLAVAFGFIFVLQCFIWINSYRYSLTKSSSTTSNHEQKNLTPEEIVYDKYVSSVNATNIHMGVDKIIQDRFPEGLDFGGWFWSRRRQDLLKIGSFNCYNTFEGKASKKEYSYTYRYGANKLLNGGKAKLYYLGVNGNTWYWDKEGEEKFISDSNRILVQEIRKEAKNLQMKKSKAIK